MNKLNPYNYTLPVGEEMFFGRDADVEMLLRALIATPGDSLALVGGRRMGKTSLLEAVLRRIEVEEENSDNGLILLPIFLDLSGEWLISVKDFFDLVCTKARWTLCASFSNTFSENIFELPANCPPGPAFRTLLQTWNRVLMQETGCKLRLILLLDECEQIVTQPWVAEFYSALRYLLVGRTTRAVLKVVMTGSHPFLTQVRQNGSPLRNVLKYHMLHTLDVKAERALISQPTKETLSEIVISAIVNLSGGHPFLTQYIMHNLWENDLSSVTPEHVQSVTDKFPHKRQDFYDWLMSIGSTGIQIYQILVMASTPLLENQIHLALQSTPPDFLQALDALCYHGLVMRDVTSAKYAIAGTMFRAWFEANVKESLEALSEAAPTRTLPLASEIVVHGDYVAGNKPTGVDQRNQQVDGAQTNVAGNANGPLASGQFQSATTIGDGQATDARGEIKPDTSLERGPQ